MISDFHLGHFSYDETSHKAMYSTLGWTAPELWNSNGERTTAVDIFSLGCVFYYVLSIGGHPFGTVADLKGCQQNIEDNQMSLSGFNEHTTVFDVALVEDLIREMIHWNGANRPEACDVLSHPLLSWDSKEMVEFFHRIGNYMEDKQSSDINRLKDMLEQNAAVVFQGSCMERLDKIVRNYAKAGSS